MRSMPITSGAKKALRASKRKRVFNLRRKSAIESTVKEVKKLVAAKKMKEPAAALAAAYQAIDKGSKSNFVSKNTASRKKSRLAALLKKAAVK